MQKIELNLPDYLADFLQAGTQAYARYFTRRDEAASVFVEMIAAEYVVSRLAVLVEKKQLLSLQDDPAALFDFASNYLRARAVGFEQGKADSDWAKKIMEGENETKK